MTKVQFISESLFGLLYSKWGGIVRLFRELVDHRETDFESHVGSCQWLIPVKEGIEVKHMASVTLKISAPTFTNPIVIAIDPTEISSPIPVDAVFKASSPAGSASLETITVDLSVGGLEIVKNHTIDSFPLDVAGKLGWVGSIVKAADATIELDVVAG